MIGIKTLSPRIRIVWKVTAWDRECGQLMGVIDALPVQEWPSSERASYDPQGCPSFVEIAE